MGSTTPGIACDLRFSSCFFDHLIFTHSLYAFRAAASSTAHLYHNLARYKYSGNCSVCSHRYTRFWLVFGYCNKSACFTHAHLALLAHGMCHNTAWSFCFSSFLTHPRVFELILRCHSTRNNGSKHILSLHRSHLPTR